jgi:hypothetical protein
MRGTFALTHTFRIYRALFRVRVFDEIAERASFSDSCAGLVRPEAAFARAFAFTAQPEQRPQQPQRRSRTPTECRSRAGTVQDENETGGPKAARHLKV